MGYDGLLFRFHVVHVCRESMHTCQGSCSPAQSHLTGVSDLGVYVQPPDQQRRGRRWIGALVGVRSPWVMATLNLQVSCKKLNLRQNLDPVIIV